MRRPWMVDWVKQAKNSQEAAVPVMCETKIRW